MKFSSDSKEHYLVYNLVLLYLVYNLVLKKIERTIMNSDATDEELWSSQSFDDEEHRSHDEEEESEEEGQDLAVVMMPEGDAGMVMLTSLTSQMDQISVSLINSEKMISAKSRTVPLDCENVTELATCSSYAAINGSYDNLEVLDTSSSYVVSRKSWTSAASIHRGYQTAEEIFVLNLDCTKTRGRSILEYFREMRYCDQVDAWMEEEGLPVSIAEDVKGFKCKPRRSYLQADDITGDDTARIWSVSDEKHLFIFGFVHPNTKKITYAKTGSKGYVRLVSEGSREFRGVTESEAHNDARVFKYYYSKPSDRYFLKSFQHPELYMVLHSGWVKMSKVDERSATGWRISIES